MALISETMLRASDKLKIPGYHVYRRDDRLDCGRAYRGLVVLVNRRIVHQPLPDPPLENIIALGVEICIDGHPLKLFSIYRPPGGPLNSADLQSLLPHATDTCLMAAGDWNCKSTTWNSLITNSVGKHLLEYADRHGYDISGPDTPTHYPDQQNYMPDVIDIAVHKGLPAPPILEVLTDEVQSDHQPVLMILQSRPASLQPPPPRPRIDWPTFQDAIQETIPSRPISSAVDVDELTTEITATIQLAKDKATLPPRQARNPQTPAKLARLLQEKRRLRKTWQRTRDPAIKTKLNAMCEEVRSHLEETHTAAWERRIEEASDDWPSLHRICRQLRGAPPPHQTSHTSRRPPSLSSRGQGRDLC